MISNGFSISQLTKHVVVITFLTLTFFDLVTVLESQKTYFVIQKKQYESMSLVTQNKYRGKRPCETLSKTMKLPCRYSTVHQRACYCNKSYISLSTINRMLLKYNVLWIYKHAKIKNIIYIFKIIWLLNLIQNYTI